MRNLTRLEMPWGVNHCSRFAANLKTAGYNVTGRDTAVQVMKRRTSSRGIAKSHQRLLPSRFLITPLCGCEVASQSQRSAAAGESLVVSGFGTSGLQVRDFETLGSRVIANFQCNTRSRSRGPRPSSIAFPGTAT